MKNQLHNSFRKKQLECFTQSKHRKNIPKETELMKINTQKKTEIKR